MDQPQYGDETRRQVGGLDREDYGAPTDDEQGRAFPAGDAMPPPKVHHERHDPFEGHTGLAIPQASPPGNEPGKLPSGHEMMNPPAVAGGFEGESMVKELEDKRAFQGFHVPEKAESGGVPSEKLPSAEKEIEGGGSAEGGGIIDIHNLKDDYVDLSESRSALPSADSPRPDERSEVVPEGKEISKDLEGPPADERGGIIDVNSLKDDYIDLSEPKHTLPDEAVHEPQESSGVVPEEKSQDQSTDGGGFIDVHNLKDNYTDLSRGQQEPGSDVYSAPQSVSPAGALSQEEPMEVPSPIIDRELSQASDGAKPEDTARLTSQIESPADDPKQEEAAEIHKPVVDDAQFPQTLQDEGDLKREGLQHDDSPFSLKKEENAELSSTIEPPIDELGEEQTGDSVSTGLYKPESGGFYSAGIVTDHPRDLDDVRDVQEGSKRAEQEPPPSPEENIGLQDAEEIDRPESKVPDPTYVLGGRPECGIVVPSDTEKNAQEREVESLGESGERNTPQEFLDGGEHDYKPGATVTDEENPLQHETKEADEEKEFVTPRELPLDMAYGGAGVSEVEKKEADEEKEFVTPRELPLDMAYGGAGVSEVVDAEKKEETESAIPLDSNIIAGPLHDDRSEGAEEKPDVKAPLDESKREITSFDEQAKDLAYEPPQIDEKAEEMEKFGVTSAEEDDVGEIIDENSGVEPQIADYLPEEESKEVKGEVGDEDGKSDLGLPVPGDKLANPLEKKNAEAEALSLGNDIAVVPAKDSSKEPIKFDAEGPDVDAEEPDVAPADDKSGSVAHGNIDVMEDVGATTAIPLEKNVRDTADEQPALDPEEVPYDIRDMGEQKIQDVKGSLGRKEEDSLLEEPIPDHRAISLPEEQEGKMEASSVDHDTVYAPEETSANQKMEFGDGEDVSREIPADILTAGMKAEEGHTALQEDRQPDQALDSEQGGVQEPDISKSKGTEEVVPQVEFGDREEGVSRGIPADIFTASMKGEEEPTTLQKDPQPEQALDLEEGGVQEPDIHKSEGTEEVVPPVADDSTFSGTADGIEGVAVPLDKDIGDGAHLDERTEGAEERREVAAPGDEYSKAAPAGFNDENVAHGSLIDGHTEEAKVPGADVSTDSVLAAPMPADTRPEEQNAEMKGEVGDKVAHPPVDGIARPPDAELNVPPQDDVKPEFGGEPVPRDMDLTEAMEQEEERKQTDDHPLEETAPKEGAAEGEAPVMSLHRHVDAMVDDEDKQVASKKPGDGGDLQDGIAISGHGKEGEGEDGGRPGQPQPEDLKNVDIKSRDMTPTPTPATADREPAQPPVDDQHEREPEHHHKKGVFERIKDKLTPPYHIHSH